ncbi:MAG TPA: peptidyl-alpha-hydroxyglycine alpha-amidating lyase family protein [Methylomirabilota bacterium]|nr:peptidyl-alpha-hydroxyglycine alpha-amidating lyase family protein [Methylomirabilota bacterium]
MDARALSRPPRAAARAGCRRRAAVVAAALAGAVAAAGVAAAADRPPRVDVAVGYAVDPHWPQRPGDVVWEAMPGTAVDLQGHVWTFNRGSVPVQVYTTDGTLVRTWGKGEFKNPHNIRIDREGHVWASDTLLHTVRKFTRDGRLLLTLGTAGQAGADAAHFDQPTDMAITPAGDVFVADGYGNNRIVHFDAGGRFVKAWGRPGTAPGEFSLPHAIALDSRGRLYVADRNNVRVQVFEQSGKFLAQWTDLITPWGIWITPQDEIYVCGSSPMQWRETTRPFLGVPPRDQIVMKLDPTGRVRELWTFPKGQDGKETPGELNWVHGIAVDAMRSLYLGDINGKRAQRFIRIEPPGAGRQP